MPNVILWTCPKCSTAYDHIPWWCWVCAKPDMTRPSQASFADDSTALEDAPARNEAKEER